MPAESAQAFVRKYSARLHVKTCIGSFSGQRIGALLPGPVADPESVDDHHLIVDMTFHEADLALLKAAGVVDSPVTGRRGVARARVRRLREGGSGSSDMNG